MSRSIHAADVTIAVALLSVIMLIIVPLSPGVLSVLQILNLALSLLVLLITLYIRETLEFSIFPSLLLVTTLLRMALNISATRLILGNNGEAGSVVGAFGDMVVGGNMVVGVIIFLIIVIVQFIVITKGSERVSEVAARFTLDAMPGKQMAIDADLNSGLIDESQARARREKIQREANFYGSMDGASKFVKGDAIVGILITAINIVGGMILGVTMGGMEISQVVDVYLLSSIGNGLVIQIPALMVSVAMGIIVTRAASDGSMGEDFRQQMFSRPMALLISGGAMAALAAVPGLPPLPLVMIGALFLTLGILQHNAQRKLAAVPDVDMEEEMAQEKRKPENVAQLLQVDPIELDLGYSILPLLDASQGGDLLDRVVMIRRQCALELGIIVPVIRLRDNVQIGASEYMIKIKGVEVAKGEILMDHYLALNPGGAQGDIQGIDTIEPTFGLAAKWISEAEREKAELLGYTTIDTPSVIATHLTEVIKRNGYELLSRQQVQMLIDNLKQTQAALVEEVVPKLFSLGEVQKVLANLLRENIPIRDMSTILETMSDWAGVTRDPDSLTEYVRQALKRTITRRFVQGKRARVVTLDARLEQQIAENIRQTEYGSYVALQPDVIQRSLMSLKAQIERLTGVGITPIVLTSPVVRRHFKRMTESMVPDLTVLSYQELEQDVEIFADGMVSAA